jgi:hypothetical protein
MAPLEATVAATVAPFAAPNSREALEPPLLPLDNLQSFLALGAPPGPTMGPISQPTSSKPETKFSIYTVYNKTIQWAPKEYPVFSSNTYL